MNNPQNSLNGNNHTLAKQFKEDGFFPYCRRVALLVAALMIVGILAPKLPIFVIAIAVIGYALLSTCGQLFDVVIRRKHKQFKLEEEGKISRINRRWVVSLVVCFTASSVSGILFILEAPRWGLLEWLFLWIAVPGFFVIYEIVRKRLSKEFKPWALKAIALRWSFIILAILLCLVYAVIGTNSWGGYPSLEAAFQSVDDPFVAAESALLGEMSYISTFTDGLTNYGLSVLASEPNMGQGAVFAIRFISYAIIILGLASQYGACLLSKKEIESEFRLLPDTEKEQEKTELVKRYFVLLGIITIALFSILCVGENIALELRSKPEYTPIKAGVESTKQELILRIDKGKNLSSEVTSNVEKDEEIKEKSETIEGIISGALSRQRVAVENYYANCLNVADAYVDWYYDEKENVFKMIGRLFGSIAADTAFNQFKDMLASSEDLKAADQVYQSAQDSINDAVKDRVSLNEPNSLSILENINNGGILDENKFAKDYLIPKDGESREDFRARLHALIEQDRDTRLNELNSLSSSLELASKPIW